MFSNVPAYLGEKRIFSASAGATRWKEKPEIKKKKIVIPPEKSERTGNSRIPLTGNTYLPGMVTS